MTQIKGKEILVVEDDDDLREIISDAFSVYGAHTKTAKNGEAAFELVRANRFDVVISDIQMPGGDGLDLMKRIAQLPPPKPLCFLWTGHYGKSDFSLQALEVLKVFEKPFKTSEMIEAMGKFLAKKAD